MWVGGPNGSGWVARMAFHQWVGGPNGIPSDSISGWVARMAFPNGIPSPQPVATVVSTTSRQPDGDGDVDETIRQAAEDLMALISDLQQKSISDRDIAELLRACADGLDGVEAANDPRIRDSAPMQVINAPELPDGDDADHDHEVSGDRVIHKAKPHRKLREALLRLERKKMSGQGNTQGTVASEASQASPDISN